MSPARHAPPAPDPADELARELARRHAARRKVPAVVAIAALALGLGVAAATDAGAAPLDAGYATTAAGGHAGHALPAVRGVGDGRRSQGGDEARGQGENADDQRGDDDRAGDDDRGGRGNGRDDDRADDGGPERGENRADEEDGDRRNVRGDDNGLDVLARDCSRSRLDEHTGFQVAPACSDTAFGEVAAADKGPSLLITDAPTEARVGRSFTLKVSTRNLVRDRFLGAAAGGYYLESSLLTSGGLQRGHFHTACRMLSSTREAPGSGESPAFFTATQDNGGGADPDTVTITVTGLPERGTAQCSSWAGDGSHRIPMMQRADQTPAFDSVRITVK